jgi:hypothetical protein
VHLPHAANVGEFDNQRTSKRESIPLSVQ